MVSGNSALRAVMRLVRLLAEPPAQVKPPAVLAGRPKSAARRAAVSFSRAESAGLTEKTWRPVFRAARVSSAARPTGVGAA